MTYAIVYESSTGNTEQLAQAVAAALPSGECRAFGRVDEVDRAAVAQVDRVYAGFWTNRGDCGDELAEVLATLADKDVFLFGTAGFGADATYFAGVMSRVAVHLPASAQVVGSFMCQGRMPASVRARYAQTAAAKPEQAARMQQLIDNFDEAANHPNDDDLARLRAAVEEAS
ncbi:flavodoxin family protein BilS [Eggerthella guodeyinii]|uniref:Flavodoxin n=1 Tax=Eggerthella guodeyinii TaxID=2690837 RepID=A0A6N7RLK7_9ACTN|nr:flavodoxin family protein BilS [Eggerthella guodeyinii]MRX82215.1 flavodoxin [Eggerthella guodeyinii]